MLKKNKTWMIRIDHISFDFSVPDERFAQNLYADWNHFCHRCFERVAEECLAPYGDDGILHELERLELDLGNIPEENFYHEFPRRLKEALQNALPPLHDLQAQANPRKTAVSRINNLLFQLEYGHLLPEWADTDFHLQKEIERLTDFSGTLYDTFIRKAALLCLKQEHTMRRLVCQTEQEKLLLDILAASLAESSVGQAEKRRLLALLLEVKSDIPIFFVHRTGDSNQLQGMSDLLETLSVRQLIRAETKEHAEVDLPPYWHYLYEWLVTYYPYNGIAMFGNKTEFTRHLHHRLLTFIHKRNGVPYLSKEELTIGFLLEVFGPTYYKDVLNAIYLLQPRNPNGSPVYDHYFNYELYRMFLQLSLLRLPETAESNPTTDEVPYSVTATRTDMRDLHTILKDPARSDAYKKMLWTMLVREQPKELVEWLQSESRKDDTLLTLLAKLAEDTTINRLLATYSLTILDTWTALRDYLEKHWDSLTWPKGISDTQWKSAFRYSALCLLASGASGQADNVSNVLRLVYRKVTGSDMNEAAAVDTLVRQLKEAGLQISSNEWNEITDKNDTNLQKLYRMVYDLSLSETAKRRIIAHYWDSHRECFTEAVCLLQELDILDDVLKLTDRYAWENILHRILCQAVGMEKASTLIPLYEWLADKNSLRTRLLLDTVRLAQDGNGNSLPLMLKQMVQDTLSETIWTPDTEQSGNISLEVLLKKALLAYLQDPEMLNKTWDEKNITNKFLHYLQRTVTGKEQDTTDTGQWQQLAETITVAESGHAVDQSPKELIQALTSPSVSRVSMQESLASLMDKHPEELLAWLEQEADSNEIIRMAEVTDHMQITYWTDCLALTPGFDQSNGLRQLIAWLLQRMPAREVATALFLYVKEPGWKTFTMEQTETYFFSRLYGQTDVLPPVETLADKDLPETMQKRLFHRYLRYQPEKLLAYLREASSRNTLPTDEWLPKTDISGWLYLAASLSLAKAELLRQITDSLSLPEEERKKALVTYLLHSDTKEWPYITPQETIRDFFKVMPSMQHVASEKKEEVVCQVINRLNLSETEIASPEDQPEILTVSNAGLCLLAPWFVRLFAMLGYLDEERKQFRNTASKVRAVFLLQYLVCGEEKPWREIELTFNRLLTALPGHVPLPKYLSLTDEERQTADSMAAGVKANWQQMNGTSVEGFRGSFLVRKGKLEQEEERWLLIVEEKAYDILLETIPWGFRQIRLPWLKKYVQVKWHEKQIF